MKNFEEVNYMKEFEEIICMSNMIKLLLCMSNRLLSCMSNRLYHEYMVKVDSQNILRIDNNPILNGIEEIVIL